MPPRRTAWQLASESSAKPLASRNVHRVCPGAAQLWRTGAKLFRRLYRHKFFKFFVKVFTRSFQDRVKTFITDHAIDRTFGDNRMAKKGAKTNFWWKTIGRIANKEMALLVGCKLLLDTSTDSRIFQKDFFCDFPKKDCSQTPFEYSKTRFALDIWSSLSNGTAREQKNTGPLITKRCYTPDDRCQFEP